MTITNLDAPIVAVTVFVDRGRITRRGSIHLAAGAHTLVIANAPDTIDPESIRATGRGAGIRILGVDMVTRYVTETPDLDTKALEKVLLDLQDRDAALNDQDTAECNQMKLLDSLRDSSGARFARALAIGKANIDSFKPVSQYLTDELNAVYQRRRAIAVQKRELAREIQVTRNRLDQSGSTQSREWHDIQVDVEANAETDLELEVVYAVSDCSWEPLYDVRLVDNQVSLTYLAQVTQQSGEDWPAVELSLSTARPATRMTLPKLAPWYVNKYVPPPPQPPRTMHRAAMPVAAPAAMQAGTGMSQDTAYTMAAPPEAEYEEAAVESSGAVVTYRVARPAAIASDGSPHKTMVTTVTLSAKLDYVIVPKVATEAYLRARISNSSPLMLLPGKAQIFHGAEYVGAMRLPRTIAPNEEFEAQLGIEDRIKVERELAERTTTRTIVGNIRRVTIGYKLKLTNNLATQAHVVVSDQIPVSLSEDIKIRLQDTQPKPAEQTEKNMLKWEFDLAPQAKREIPFTFVLEYPRDLTITGLGDLEPAE
jgi:uncharacterized protein (TIGR02231 family)